MHDTVLGWLRIGDKHHDGTKNGKNLRKKLTKKNTILNIYGDLYSLT